MSALLATPPIYTQETHDIQITVYPLFLDNQSNPKEHHYLWAYHVKIENNGDTTLQLRSRFWRIIDQYGRIQDVSGSGVVGEQPILNPGDSFEYTSGTPLSTPCGMMEGHYIMETSDGEMLQVNVPCFSLDSPFSRQRIH